MTELLYKDESYLIIGKCMEIHRLLGFGFKEAVYKDALELELQAEGIPFQREKRFEVVYKNVVLRHHYVADFVVFDRIILEIKANAAVHEAFTFQTVNYLKASGLRLGMIINFGEKSLRYHRVIL